MTGQAVAPLLVATDLDACLLDERTYAWEPAREALTALKTAGVPLVLVSSKTRAEMDGLAEALGGVSALVFENGGGFVHRPGAREASVGLLGPFETPVVETPLGVPRDQLVRALQELAAEAGARVRGFAQMTPREAAELTGLPLASAARALARRYDEPFVLHEGDAERLSVAARARGLQVTRGGRFFHLCGPMDKGAALRALLGELERSSPPTANGRRSHCVALGDSPNDLSLLQVADRPIIVLRPDGRPDATLSRALPAAEITPFPGPAGWNHAVLAVLGGRRLGSVASQDPP